MNSFILSIDQGTTGSTALLIDQKGKVIAKHNEEFPQIFPQPSWVEHNLDDIWKSVRTSVKNVLQENNIDPQNIKAIGITNQRETVGLWNHKGEPLHNAIVWQCRRTADICKKLQPHEETVFQKTGLVLDAYFSATKIRWLINHLKLRNFKNTFCGTMDTFLTFKLTGGQSHVTDASNASRTMLMDLKSLQWDEELLSIFDVPSSILPSIHDSSEIVGHTHNLDFLPDGIPIAGIAGDQQAALFGQACFSPQQAKCTYGTGAFLLANTGERIIHSQHKLITTVAWKIGKQTHYALEGSVFIAGAAVQWLRDGLGIIKQSSEVQALATSVQDTGGVMFVPAFTGLGAPYWNPQARGTLTGITRGTTKAHIARATLESIGLQVSDVVTCMEEDMKQPLQALKIDGGASVNDLLMQFQSDIIDRELTRPTQFETTALGAAYLAGLAIGFWKDQKEIQNIWQADQTYTPQMKANTRKEKISSWKQAVRKSF